MVKRVYARTTALADKPLKASQLITQLEKAIELYGDIPVRIWTDDFDMAFPFILEPPSERIEQKYPKIHPCLTLRWEETVAYVRDEEEEDEPKDE